MYHNIWGWLHKWGKCFVNILGNVSLGFTAFEYIDELTFVFGGWVLEDGSVRHRHRHSKLL